MSKVKGSQWKASELSRLIEWVKAEMSFTNDMIIGFLQPNTVIPWRNGTMKYVTKAMSINSANVMNHLMQIGMIVMEQHLPPAPGE